MKKIIIDKEKCIGCGLCSSIAEKTFRLNSKNKAEVINPVGDDDNSIKEAASSCPVNAIKISR